MTSKEFEYGSDDGMLITETESGDRSTYAADRVLVALGREPGFDTLSIENAEIEADEWGFIPTNDRARTSQKHIFAAGGVTGEPMLAHVASIEGIVAAEGVAGEAAALDRYAIPAAVFPDPEIATVGRTEAEAREAGVEPIVGQVPF